MTVSERDHGAPGKWPSSGEDRLLDAYRDVAAERSWSSVDLVEVKQGLNEGVVGQALAAEWMFANAGAAIDADEA